MKTFNEETLLEELKARYFNLKNGDELAQRVYDLIQKNKLNK